MTTILDIAEEDGRKLAERSIACRRDGADRGQVIEYFTRKRFRELYRDKIFRERRRTPSNRECDIALAEMIDLQKQEAEA